jgi:hypothetical protein
MFKTVSQEIKMQRLATCKKCTHYVSKLKTCTQCGCYVPAKTMFAKTTCPVGNWNEATPDNSIVGVIEESILKLWNE